MSDANSRAAQPAPAGARAPARNPLLLPLAAVSAVALCEAVVIGILWVRDHPPPVAVAVQAGAPPAAAPADAPTHTPRAAPSTGGPSTARGKVGERVESAGLAITVVGVSNQPTGPSKDLISVTPDQKFLDVDLVIENNTGRPFQYWPVNFRLRDAHNYTHQPNTLRVNPAALEWGTIVQGEKVRGHLEFTVPRTATGLHLVYPTADLPGYKGIHIDLGQ